MYLTSCIRRQEIAALNSFTGCPGSHSHTDSSPDSFLTAHTRLSDRRQSATGSFLLAPHFTPCPPDAPFLLNHIEFLLVLQQIVLLLCPAGVQVPSAPLIATAQCGSALRSSAAACSLFRILLQKLEKERGSESPRARL